MLSWMPSAACSTPTLVPNPLPPSLRPPEGSVTWGIEKEVKESLEQVVVSKECPVNKSFVPSHLPSQVIHWAHTGWSRNIRQCLIERMFL